ncbi:MAG TPA: adenosylhomocysteinase [Trichormus sp.]
MHSTTSNFKSELDWARTHMRRVSNAIASLPDLTGTRIACCTHLDLKMVPAFEGLIRRGASLYLTTCNPHTVQEETVQHLSTEATVDAWRGMDHDSWQKSLRSAMTWSPTHLCEMGAELTREAHEPNAKPPEILAGVEATSSGISLLQSIDLQFPVFNWNNVPVKEHLHNRRMVGISTWHTFFERTRLTLHEKRVIVIGYGAVGQSVADSAHAFGGNVCIVERDAGRALEAKYFGWDVLPLETALPQADVIVTATGAPAVLGPKQFESIKSGAFLLNVGHRNDEIDTAALLSYPHRSVLPFVQELDINGHIVYLFAGGSMANLAAGYGDSLNAFDLTLAIMIAAIGYAVSSADKYQPLVHELPKNVWESIL